MSILDRYVWKEIAFPFFVGLLVLTFLLLIDKIFDLMDLIINKGVPVTMVLRLLAYMLPAFLVLTIPVSFLLGILVAFGRLSADMEVVALRACGLSSLRLLRPVLVFGVATAAVTGVLMFQGMPRGNYAFKSLIFDILRTHAAAGVKERVFTDAFRPFVIYIEEMKSDRVSLRNVFVADERKPDEPRVITASEGRLLSDQAKQRLTLHLVDGAQHETVLPSFDTYRHLQFVDYELSLTLDNNLVQEGQAPKGDREMTVTELRGRAAEAEAAGASANRYWVEIHKKYAIPAACLVFAVLGVPLGIRAHRAGRWAAFVMLLPIVFFYWVSLSLGESMGDAGRIPPWLGMWAPNVIVGSLGLYLLWANVRERSLPVPVTAQRVVAALAARTQDRRSKPVRPGARRQRRPGGPRPVARRNATNLVDRYLTREFLTLFVYGLALTTIIVIVSDLMTTLDRYMQMQPPFEYIVEHYLYRTPAFVYQGLHFVVLLSTILLFLGLSRSNELTALKASGVSLYRVSLPIFALAGLVTLGSLFFQERVLPILNQKGSEVDEIKIKKRPRLMMRTDIWYRGREGSGPNSRIYHIELLDPGSRELTGVSLLELDPDFVLRRRWDARAMRWRESDQSWELEDGILREFDPAGLERRHAFRRTTLQLPERIEDFGQVRKAPDVMNYSELREYIHRLQDAGHKVGKYLVDLYSKVAFPFAHLIMALVGIPFALQSPRAGRLIGIALGLALGLSYFLVHSAAIALARGDILPPIVAAWSANALFSMLGLYLFFRVRT